MEEPLAGRRSAKTRRALALKVTRNVALGLVMTELLLRVVLGNFAQSRLLRHSKLPGVCLEATPNIDMSYTGWLLRTGATRMRTNSLGGRGVEIAEKRPGSLRVLHLGDSFAFGQGVEEHETFGMVAARELATERMTVETLNFGVPGHGTPQSVALLEQKLLPLQPDVVLLHVFANDLSAEDSYCLRGPREGQLPLERWLLLNVYISRVLAVLASPLRQVPTPEDIEALGTPEERFRKAIGKATTLAREHGFLFGVVLLTDRTMFTDSRYCRGCSAPHDLLQKLDARVLDMSGTWLRLQEEIRDNYIFGEGHLSVTGSEVMGSALAEELRTWPEFARRAGVR